MRGRDIIARNLRRIRVANDVSQERLAFDAGVDRSYLGGVERAEENPSVDVLDKLAATLGVHLGELFLPVAEGVASEPGLKRGRKSKRLALDRKNGDRPR